MIELLILRAFYRSLAATAEGKNRPRKWGLLGIFLWIAGEITGFVVAGVDSGGSGYLAALVFAAIGAGIAFVVVNSLSTLPPEDFPTASIHRN